MTIKRLLKFAAVTAAFVVGGCATPRLALDPVGPAPETKGAALGEGYLKVFSAREGQLYGGDTPYSPHSEYHVRTPAGQPVKHVQNHVGPMDESAMLVSLPTGRYEVLAEADGFGRVRVPILIKQGELTEVNLETIGRSKGNAGNDPRLVRLPNGWAVGWRAEAEAETSPQGSP